MRVQEFAISTILEFQENLVAGFGILHLTKKCTAKRLQTQVVAVMIVE